MQTTGCLPGVVRHVVAAISTMMTLLMANSTHGQANYVYPEIRLKSYTASSTNYYWNHGLGSYTVEGDPCSGGGSVVTFSFDNGSESAGFTD